MAEAEPWVAGQGPGAPSEPDPDSTEWLRVLADAGPVREAALARLHAMLLP
ncbi:MAG TPA: hypothetical protein VF162_10820 [Streptosporangiaceae bacterium]